VDAPFPKQNSHSGYIFSSSVSVVYPARFYLCIKSVKLHSDKAFVVRLVVARSSSSARTVSEDKFIAVLPVASSPAGFNIVKPIAAISNQKKDASIITTDKKGIGCDKQKFA
jgi:hypothetical protein